MQFDRDEATSGKYLTGCLLILYRYRYRSFHLISPKGHRLFMSSFPVIA